MVNETTKKFKVQNSYIMVNTKSILIEIMKLSNLFTGKAQRNAKSNYTSNLYSLAPNSRGILRKEVDISLKSRNWWVVNR